MDIINNIKRFADPSYDKELTIKEIHEYGVLGYATASNSTFQKYSDDIDVMTVLTTYNGEALFHASDRLKNDPLFVSHSLQNSGLALQFASDLLKNDRGIIQQAITGNGKALQYASEELRADRGIVSLALAQNGYALEYASADLKSDKEVVSIALAQNGFTLLYASDELKADKEFVLLAVTYDKDAILCASHNLQALCKEKNPIKALQASILADELKAEMKPKPEQIQKPKLKI